MKLTNEQILNSLMILSKLDEKGMLGYAIAKNRKKLTEECKEYAEKRDELLKEFGTDVGNGQYQIMPEKVSDYIEALKPYAELEVDVAVMTVSPDVFCSGSLTSSQMFALDWMVTEE